MADENKAKESCCDLWLYRVQPIKIKPDSFTESRACPSCGSKYEIHFEFDESNTFMASYKVIWFSKVG